MTLSNIQARHLEGFGTIADRAQLIAWLRVLVPFAQSMCAMKPGFTEVERVLKEIGPIDADPS